MFLIFNELNYFSFSVFTSFSNGNPFLKSVKFIINIIELKDEGINIIAVMAAN